MNVRATGRAIRNVSKKPMQEVYSLTFTDEGKLQQFLWYIEADKKELYENAFTKD
jgi:outer membrane protein assembly factor BamE (lipoprotein component of BamABCDE complex)